jgi:hypothetical protein
MMEDAEVSTVLFLPLIARPARSFCSRSLFLLEDSSRFSIFSDVSGNFSFLLVLSIR